MSDKSFFTYFNKELRSMKIIPLALVIYHVNDFLKLLFFGKQKKYISIN